MRTNTRAVQPKVYTHEGAKAFAHLNPVQALRRSVLATMLFEGQFYEDGEEIATRISELAAKVPINVLCDLAIEARSKFNLRHVPLLLLLEAVKRGGPMVWQAIRDTIQRPDEIPELLAMWWKYKGGRKPIPKQLKKGLAAAFPKFNAYSLAKYNRDDAIKLRDVLFMVHAKPKDETQAQVWKHLAEGTLASPDTWEVELSAGKDKKATFERLIGEKKLGYLALLRNLRNMQQAGVNDEMVRNAIAARAGGAERVLPFRYTAAARAAPAFEPELDKALLASLEEMPKLPGTTIVLVDVSGSMDVKLSSKSDLTRADAAATLAAILPGNVRMFSFSDRLVEVPPRKGMAGVDAILNSQVHSGTKLGAAVKFVNEKFVCDRLIIITDEQANDTTIPPPVAEKAYMINVASYKNGVGYGRWVHIDGFSEAVLRWIHEYENQTAET